MTTRRPPLSRQACWIALISLVILWTVGGCVGTDIGNPDQDPDADHDAHVAPDADVAPDTHVDPDVDASPQPTNLMIDYVGYEAPPTPGGLTLSTGLTYDVIWLQVARLDFYSVDDCAAATPTLSLEGPFAVELTTSALYGPPSEVAVTRDLYCRVSVTLAPAATLPEGAPAELDAAAILATGTRPDGIPFILRAEAPVALDLEAVAAQGFTLPEGDVASLIAFEIGDLLEVSLLDGLLDLLGLGIEINVDVNADLLGAFLSRLTTSATLIIDADSDGVADPEELAAPLATTPAP